MPDHQGHLGYHAILTFAQVWLTSRFGGLKSEMQKTFVDPQVEKYLIRLQNALERKIKPMAVLVISDRLRLTVLAGFLDRRIGLDPGNWV